MDPMRLIEPLALISCILFFLILLNDHQSPFDFHENEVTSINHGKEQTLERKICNELKRSIVSFSPSKPNNKSRISQLLQMHKMYIDCQWKLKATRHPSSLFLSISSMDLYLISEVCPVRQLQGCYNDTASSDQVYYVLDGKRFASGIGSNCKNEKIITNICLNNSVIEDNNTDKSYLGNVNNYNHLGNVTDYNHLDKVTNRHGNSTNDFCLFGGIEIGYRKRTILKQCFCTRRHLHNLSIGTPSSLWIRFVSNVTSSVYTNAHIHYSVQANQRFVHDGFLGFIYITGIIVAIIYPLAYHTMKAKREDEKLDITDEELKLKLWKLKSETLEVMKTKFSRLFVDCPHLIQPDILDIKFNKNDHFCKMYSQEVKNKIEETRENVKRMQQTKKRKRISCSTRFLPRDSDDWCEVSTLPHAFIPLSSLETSTNQDKEHLVKDANSEFHECQGGPKENHAFSSERKLNLKDPMQIKSQTLPSVPLESLYSIKIAKDKSFKYLVKRKKSSMRAEPMIRNRESNRFANLRSKHYLHTRTFSLQGLNEGSVPEIFKLPSTPNSTNLSWDTSYATFDPSKTLEFFNTKRKDDHHCQRLSVVNKDVSDIEPKNSYDSDIYQFSTLGNIPTKWTTDDDIPNEAVFRPLSCSTPKQFFRLEVCKKVGNRNIFGAKASTGELDLKDFYGGKRGNKRYSPSDENINIDVRQKTTPLQPRLSYRESNV